MMNDRYIIYDEWYIDMVHTCVHEYIIYDIWYTHVYMNT